LGKEVPGWKLGGGLVEREDGASRDTEDLLFVRKQVHGTQAVEEIWVKPLDAPIEFVEEHLLQRP